MSYGGSLWDWNERSQCKTRFWKAPCTHPHPDALERYAQGLETAAVTDHAPQSARKADISRREYVFHPLASTAIGESNNESVRRLDDIQGVS
jgi:hypothetical protein